MTPDSDEAPAPADPSSKPPALGIVLSGGGARAAYQVGHLRFLARHYPELRFSVISGVSAGAINAAHLASHHGSFRQSVDELSELWAHLEMHDVLRTDSWSLLRHLVQWGAQLISGGVGGAPKVRGLVDTQPLREYLTEVLHCVNGELTGVSYNVRAGKLRALGLSTSSYTTGQSVTWIQGSDEVPDWHRPRRIGRKTTLTVEHVMASCALPLFFPAVKLEDGWYGDGGMRLAAPLSPVLHMGAEKILVVSTRYGRSAREAARPQVTGYPPPAQVLGQIVNSVFLDLLDQDAQLMERMNELLRRLPPDQREGLRIIDQLTVRPSQDLGVLAGDFEPQLPSFFRWMTRGLGTRETQSPDALSMILFEPDYLKRLMDLGEADAESRGDELLAFVER